MIFSYVFDVDNLDGASASTTGPRAALPLAGMEGAPTLRCEVDTPADLAGEGVFEGVPDILVWKGVRGVWACVMRVVDESCDK